MNNIKQNMLADIEKALAEYEQQYSAAIRRELAMYGISTEPKPKDTNFDRLLDLKYAIINTDDSEKSIQKLQRRAFILAATMG